MIELDLEPGSDKWKSTRLQNFTASEAPAMMNDSKYMSRNELLKLKKTRIEKPVDEFTQQLFDKGHKYEAMARPIVESMTDEDLKPVVGVIEGTKFLASFDGLSILEDLVFEHKSWNETLAENVRNQVLEPMYYWQLEHQLFVSGAEQAIFVVSDGTAKKMVSMYYKPVEGRREELIAGWEQFEKDLAEFEVKAIEETVIPVEIEAFPLVKYEVKGTDIVSNINDYLDLIRTKSQIELTRELETDQDFADKDLLNKATKKARVDLKNLVESVQSKFVSYAEFATTAKEIDSVLQKMQSHGEKQVNEAKIAKKAKIVKLAEYEIVDHVENIDLLIKPIRLNELMSVWPDFQSAIKGKRTIESIQNAADAVVAGLKIEADKVANKVKENLLTMRELAGEHKFLFSDTNQLVTKDNEDLIAVIKTRIADHKKAEAERLEKEREQIRIEEEAKAQKKIDDEAARVKAEQEAEDKRIADKKAKLVRQEQAEEAGRIAKEATEKREAELKGTAIADDIKIDDNGHIEEDIPFIDGDESAPYDVSHGTIENNVVAELQYRNELLTKITEWGSKREIKLEATQELLEILKEYDLI